MRPLSCILLILLLSACFSPRGVQRAELIRADKETAQVRLTGHIMLDGACTPGPHWSLEMHTDTGWIARVPFPGAQMLCGAGSWSYRKEVFNLELGRWDAYHHPRDSGPLLPGTYRLVFMAPNGRTKRTKEFDL
ncbi:MAG: hypothetical protein IPL52_01550 [Flavobacteriales bacterium]|nr:hypothetical protein [Flavobacteriales bacterium]